MRNNQNSWGREIQPGDRCKMCQIRIYWLDTIPQLLQDPFAAAIWCLGDSQDSRSPGQNFQITSCLLQDLGDMETSKTSPAHFVLQLPPLESCAEQPCSSSWTQSLHRFGGWSHMHSVGDQPLLQHSFNDLICSERLQRFSCLSWIILDQFLILLTYWLWYIMRVYVFSYDATQLIWYPANLMPRFFALRIWKCRKKNETTNQLLAVRLATSLPSRGHGLDYRSNVSKRCQRSPAGLPKTHWVLPAMRRHFPGVMGAKNSTEFLN